MPDYTAGYGGGPLGHPQNPADTPGYPRPPAEQYRPPQDQGYSQAGQSWEDRPADRTVRYDQQTYQPDVLDGPPPGPARPRQDEAIDPTAIYAPDRSARPEESPGRDQSGSGVDQQAPWYGSDR
ncbi:hypothetical protein BJ981_000360 [Sphaerisporangium krabiense]|uniref:Uncharacterized protein n=1 Tax=Sphaerisporangium krabiense TaxID=763782 RepID=A0A7W8YZH9_9ACTN|nr:hypothetical protein [Sphaerisporangium krabiense]